MQRLLNELRTYDANQLDIVELLAYRALASLVSVECGHQNVELPEWLTERAKELDREIQRRRQDELERRMKDLRARHESLATTQERREKIAQEIADLEKQLNPTPQAA